MNVKEKINGNAKWLRYGSILLALIVFVLAQGVSNGTKAEGIKNNKEDIVEIKDDANRIKMAVQQIQLDVKGIQADTKNTKDDVAEIKADQKEILKVLYQIKDK